MSRPSLNELANKHNTDKGDKYGGGSVHGYANIYDELYLSKWRDEPIRMLEVGICMELTEGGHSVRMWYDYFSKADIFTFDIVDMQRLVNDRVKFYQGDQGDRECFKQMYQSFGNQDFDFILEDGSHQHVHQMISLAHLFKYVKSGGYYILEDMSIPDHEVCCIRNDDTYRAIQNFKETGKIESKHILPEEVEYLEQNVASIEIHADVRNAYATAIITKK